MSSTGSKSTSNSEAASAINYYKNNSVILDGFHCSLEPWKTYGAKFDVSKIPNLNLPNTKTCVICLICLQENMDNGFEAPKDQISDDRTGRCSFAKVGERLQSLQRSEFYKNAPLTPVLFDEKKTQKKLIDEESRRFPASIEYLKKTKTGFSMIVSLHILIVNHNR